MKNPNALMHLVVTIVVAAMPLLNGCMLRRLEKNVERLESMTLIGGHVTRAQESEAPTVVVLTTTAAPSIIDSFVLERPGAYFFIVPAGTYRVAAFVDRNRDFVHQANEEPAAAYGSPSDIQVAAGQKVSGLDVHIGSASAAPLGFPIAVGDLGTRGTRELPPIHMGEIVTLDDPRFSAENGQLGLWQPVDFTFNVGAGFYFLEAYDAKKIPVLFVHGAGGHPDEFRYLIEHLDRDKFQPWLAYYPSGMDLEMMGRGVARWLETLVARYQIEHLVVVAHSLGGLVSRAAINNLSTSGNGDLLKLFVSISSPWNGFAQAAQGVEHSPVVMPMWRGMATGSPFQVGLFQTPLPSECPYYLLFSYNGHSRFLSEPNDGVVALSSALAAPAQRDAKKVHGFNENHVSILSSAEVSQTLNTILAGVEP